MKYSVALLLISISAYGVCLSESRENSLTTPTPCVWTCPEGATMEAEPCGEDYNGGCGMAVPDFESIIPGTFVCGTAWADQSLRDTEWYEIVTTEEAIFTWEVYPEFAVLAGMISYVEGSEGSGNCGDMAGLDPFGMGLPCELVSVTTACMPAGTYWFWLAQQEFEGQPCAGGEIDYWCTLTMAPCFEPTPTPACIHHGDVNFSGDFTVEDAQLAFQIALGFMTPTYEEWCAADCNGNGEVTAGDAQLIFSHVFGGPPCVD